MLASTDTKRWSKNLLVNIFDIIVLKNFVLDVGSAHSLNKVVDIGPRYSRRNVRYSVKLVTVNTVINLVWESKLLRLLNKKVLTIKLLHTV